MNEDGAEPVLIAGAGSTGATIALLLARRGIRSTVLDRRPTELTHPAAHVIHGRSLEIWREADPVLADTIAALAPPIESVNLTRWSSTLDGLPLGEIDLASRPEQLARVKSHGDYLISHIGQHQLMPVLWDALDREPLITFRRSTAIESVRQDDESVTVTTSQKTALTAQYLIGADGSNSAVRQAAGIAMHGPVLARMGSAFFRAPGLHRAGARPLLTWIYQPGFAGVLIAHADEHYVLMNTYLHPDQEVASTRERYWARTLREVLGSDIEFDLVSTGTWTMTSQIADKFRRGRLILAGDAAHRFPHTGGYGLNSGVQDAHNIAFKLHAVMDGKASDRLLDTYEVERRPVIELFARHSVQNHFNLDSATRHFGVTNTMLRRATTAMSRPPLTLLPGRVAAPLAERVTRAGLARTRILGQKTRRAQRVRDLVAENIPSQMPHFVSTGLEYGYRYGGTLIATEPDAQQPAEASLDVIEYLPTTVPGGRFPHTTVTTPQGPRSTLQLIDTTPTAFTVFTFDAAAWSDALTAYSTALSPFTTHVIALDDVTSPPDPVGMYEVGPHGAVVVRADGHIVWRSSQTAEVVAHQLVDFIRHSWLPYFAPGHSFPP